MSNGMGGWEFWKEERKRWKDGRGDWTGVNG